jgi:hypothetical protein
MKIVILLLLTFALFALPVYGGIESVAINPSSVWLGDPLNITAVCTGGAERMYTDITGPGIILPSLEMQDIGGGAYKAEIPGNYFDRKGAYAATLFCIANDTSNATGSFTISELTGTINSVPDFVYSSDLIEIAYLPKRDGTPITSGISFSVSLDGQPKTFAIPPVYDSSRGWLLRINAPAEAKTYSLSIMFTHDSKTVSSSSAIQIRPAVDFQITRMDKASVRPGDNISLELRATSRGADIQMNESYFTASIGSATAQSNIASRNGNLYTIRIKAPDMSPGTYTLTLSIVYNGTVYTLSKTVNYVISFSGRFADDAGRAIAAHIRMLKSGSEVQSFDTASDGTFTAQILPNHYDVEIESTDIKIKMENTDVNTADNPINITRSYTNIEGFVSSGYYTIKSGWDFDRATLTFRYDESLNQNDIYAFKCPLLYQGKCSGDWLKIKPDINSAQRLATFSVSDFSTFVIGTEDRIKLAINFDKQRYSKKDLVSIRGSVNQIPNATVRIRIPGTQIDHSLTTNSNGAFSIDLIGPENEGNYTVEVRAWKSPFAPYNGTYKIEVLSMPSISIVFPGSIQVIKGNLTSDSITIVNKGQTDITGLKISTDLEEKYYRLGGYPDSIKTGGEISVPVTFFSYTNDELTTKSANIKVVSNEISSEKIFGFTIIEAPKQETRTTGFAIAMPKMDEISYTVIFAAIAFAAAVLLKRAKNYTRVSITRTFGVNQPNYSTQTQSDSAAYLSSVKEYLRSKE